MAMIDAAVVAAVAIIVADVTSWSAKQVKNEHAAKRVSSYSVLVPLQKQLGNDYIVLATERTIIVKNRPWNVA